MVLPDTKQIMKTGLSVRTILPMVVLTYRRKIICKYIKVLFRARIISTYQP